MKVISINVNGIRAAQRKGMYEWLVKQKADFICLQEVRASEDQIDKPEFKLPGYYQYFVEAEKKGYSGVAIFTPHKPLKVTRKIGIEFADSEGRYCEVEYDNLKVVSIYLPSGTSSEDRQALKYQFMEQYEKNLKKTLKANKPTIICGDWNIAHKNIDIKNWKSNQKNSGFLPEERAWLDKLFDKMGFIDAFRVKNTNEHEYTWWSNRGRAWDNNVGWRIDYQIVTPELKDKIKKVDIYKAERFSDHAPLIVEYDDSIQP